MAHNIENYKKGQVVRFNLTNKWHYGTLASIGYKWYTVIYKKSGKTKTAKLLRENANINLAEI